MTVDKMHGKKRNEEIKMVMKNVRVCGGRGGISEGELVTKLGEKREATCLSRGTLVWFRRENVSRGTRAGQGVFGGGIGN